MHWQAWQANWHGQSVGHLHMAAQVRLPEGFRFQGFEQLATAAATANASPDSWRNAKSSCSWFLPQWQ